MDCKGILNLANSIWFVNYKDTEVLKNIEWINSNLCFDDSLHIDGLDPKHVSALQSIRSTVIKILEGDPIDKHINDLNEHLEPTLFYNKITMKEDQPKILKLSKTENIDRILSDIIIELVESVENKAIGRIRKCGVTDCQFYFLDKSKNQNKKYCSAKCNNVAKVRRFRQKSQV